MEFSDNLGEFLLERRASKKGGKIAKIRMFTFERRNGILLDMREKLRMLSFLPTIVMLCVIFSFSGQQGDASSEISHGVTYKIVEFERKIKGEQMDSDRMEQRVEEIHFYVRKMGHVSEFFLLELAMTIPCLVYGVKGKRFALYPLGCAVFCAGMDEFHQLFISGRDGALRDVLIDSIGIVLAVALVQICRKIFLVVRKR